MYKLSNLSDVRIQELKYGGISIIPKENLISNMPVIEELLYETAPIKFGTTLESFEFLDSDIIGGSRINTSESE